MTPADVVVIGGGIAGLAAAYRLRGPAGTGRGATGRRPLRCLLIEKSPRWGGKVLTERRRGFVLEGGPDAFVPHKPSALELVRELGLEDRLLPSNDGRRGLFILRCGRLVPVPDGLRMLVPERWPPLLRSPLLSWPAKLRLACEGWMPPRRTEGDESLADFVRRRLGREVLERLAEPLLAHLHVADVERLSVAAAYPQLVAVEDRYGSLSRGARAKASETSSAPAFWSLRGGMDELVEALAETLDDEAVILGRRAAHLRRTAGGRAYVVELDDGRTIEATQVVLATPAFVTAELVAGLDAGLTELLRSIPYVSLAILSLGYRRTDVEHPLDGFGFLVPRRELRTVLACTWTSTKLDHRAPADHVLLRVFLGGALGRDALALADDDLVRAAHAELQPILGLRAEAAVRRLKRWPRGYPQYEIGHKQRVRAIEDALPAGLYVAGSAFHGVGLPDCIRSGFEVADRARNRLRPGRDSGRFG